MEKLLVSLFWTFWGIVAALINAAIDAWIVQAFWPKSLFVLSYGEWFWVILMVTWVLMFPAGWYYARLKADMGLDK